MTILRGAIDHSSPDRVAGWIHSDVASVRDRTVLAFVDGRCVGASRVDIFRQDLADAGLGDGHLGFDISITVPRRGDEARVVVGLDGSDLVLLQRASRVERADAITGVAVPSFRSANSLEWMRARGWLDQMEIDLFKAVQQFGVYDRSLRLSKVAEKIAGAPVLPPEQEARQLFELLRMERVKVREQQAESVGGLSEQRVALAAATPEPVVALWSGKRSTLMVVEGSHQDGLPADYGLAGAVDYSVGPDRLLLLDLRCRFGDRYEGQSTELRVFMVAAEEAM